MSTTHFSCCCVTWVTQNRSGDIRTSIFGTKAFVKQHKGRTRLYEQLCLKTTEKKIRGSIIVHRLIQDLPCKRLDLYNSSVPHFFYSKKNSPFTQKPIVTLTPCFETQLPQLPHFHNLSWKRLKRRTAS